MINVVIYPMNLETTEETMRMFRNFRIEISLARSVQKVKYQWWWTPRSRTLRPQTCSIGHIRTTM